MHIFEITDSAAEDLVKIFEYTFKVHGENQWFLYKSTINQNIDKLIKNPLIGHSRIDIPKNCLAWKVGKHFFIYRIYNETIYLLRVLHERMDFAFHF